MNSKQAILQFINLCSMVLFVFMGWKLLGAWSDNPAPIMAVLSESMSPGFERRDVLYVARERERAVRPGDIVVFQIKKRPIPIVHRVIKVHEERATGKTLFLTKGDNNDVHDRGLYRRGQKWLRNEDLVGSVKVYLPFIGMATILGADYPAVKYAILALVVFFTLITREED